MPQWIVDLVVLLGVYGAGISTGIAYANRSYTKVFERMARKGEDA